MAEMTIADITKVLTAKPTTTTQKILSTPPPMNLSGDSKTTGGLQNIQLTKYETPITAVYDRLNNGSYVAKFENYIGATGNEDRLAKEQTTGEKWGNGLAKMGAKIGTYAFDSVVGTAYGIGAAIGTGQWGKLYDNDFASTMDDVNKRIDNNFANYYSDEEKSMGVLQSMGTANFWANDVTGGLAFVGGAILPSIALGALTGGATLSAGAGKLASKWGMNVAKKTAEEAFESAGKSGIKNYVKTKLASGLGSVVDKGAFFVRTSAFEAGMEARQSYKSNVEDFYTKFEEQHGRMPTAEEAKPFLEDARNASNGVFNANLAILSVSNAVMFGKKILPSISSDILGTADNFAANALRKGINSTVKFGEKITNQANKAIGLGVKTEMVDGVLTKSMIQATKGQKILGNIYKIAKKPLTEGLYEEGFQGVTTKTAANYLDAKYNPQNTETLSLMANLADGFKEQYGSNEGWKEMAVGMIIGFGGGGMSPGAFKKGSGAFSGIGSDSRASTQKQMEADLKRANEGVIAFRNLNRTEGARAFAVNGSEGKVARNYEDSVAGYNFIKSQEHISTPGQILEDHHKTIDAMEFQEPNMKEFLADRGVTEQEYKDSLKSSFETTLQQYRKATSHVKALGLDRAIKDTEGNKIEIGEAIVLNTMLGMSSLEESKKHLDQLDKLMGTSGTFDAHEFYQSLSEEQQDQIALLDKKTTELEELKKQAVRLGEQAAGSRPSTGQTSDQLNKQRVQTSEKAFQAQQAVIRVTQEIENLTKGLEGAYGPYQAEQRANDPNKLPQDINSVLNKLSAANNYVNSLTKAGETATTTAGTVKYLVGQAKYHSDAHREMVNMNRRMLSTNFFSSKEGKSFVGRILGKTYVMSDDLRKSIEDNDAFIDSSLRLMGQRGSESDTVVDAVKKALEANPNLSEREKHRLEDLLRLQLTGNAAEAIVKDLTTASEQIAASQVKDTKGDTVALAKKLKDKTKDITTLKVITEVIDEITSELDGIINSNGKNSAEIAKLKEELQTLKEKRDAIEESNKQEEISREQSGADQYQGTPNRQQEEWEVEGQPGETTANEADNSDSTITSETQEEVIPSIEVLEENKSEIDSLIEQRIANYGLEPFDIFEGMSEADISIIERAKRGEAVDMNALQGTLDFIYKVYKDLVELKKPENSKDRLVKSLTLEYLEQVQSILEEDLEFLQTYKNANETGETLPTFEYSTESTVVTSTEGGATETITRVAPETTTQPTELEKIDAEIVAIENRIKKLEGERYQIIESQEYARFTQLSAKKEKGELTPNEEAELEELKDDLDKWTMITGVVIDGFRLSDLIEQKVVLESTPIIAPELVVVQETQETMQDIDIPDKTKGANTTFGNTAHKVIFSTEGTGDKKVYTIYHLTQSGLIKEIGDLPIKTDRLDERNNILLTAEEVKLINENTDLKIITDSKYSRASTVIKAKTMSDGSIQYKGLDSDFNDELREGIDFQAVYEANGRTEDAPGDEIEVFVDPKSDYNKFHLARIRNLFKELKKIKNNPTTKKNIRDKIKEEKVWLQENLQVMARINGRVVATFKGIREGVKNDTDLLFAEFRKAIVNDDTNLEAITSDTANGVITVKVKGKDGISRKPVITVKQVLLGIPNYNYDQNADGTMSTVFKPIPEQQQGKVIDMGYSLNGKTFTRDGKTVNTTFLANMTKRNKTDKIPFVVLEVGGQRVAYPVRVETSKEVNTEEFEAIYNSERSDSDKAKSLNRFMAANGIDIKEAGNAFISFGVTNLTDENFQNKLAQLKAINYFYNVEEWITEEADMKDILTNQITIDIDVENPFHSPKLMFDYEALDLAKGKVTKESTATQTSNNIDPEAGESSLFC